MILQLLAEFGRVLGGSERVDESLERGDGGVDLKYAGSHRLRRVLFAVAPGSERPSSLDVLKAHFSMIN